MKGFKIGSNVHIGLGSIIIAENAEIGNNVRIDYFSVIRAKKVEIGEYSSIASICFLDTEYLKIGKDTKIREQVILGGLKTPESKLIVGDRCLIAQSVFVNTYLPVIIGNDSGIGGRSLLFTHSSRLSQLEGFPVKFGPIKIGNNVWISWNSFIGSGVDIGDYVVVQPNTVVSKNIPPNSIFTGSGNRIVPNLFYKPVAPEERIQIVKQIIDDFIIYMDYEGIKAEQENGSIYYSIDNLNYRIIIQEHENVEIQPNYQNILLTFKELNTISAKRRNNDMVISFNDKTRVGTNLLGEELLTFFSRYGIRFIRENHD